MALKLHNLKPAKGAKKRRKRIGRGDSSGHGSYSTRGIKGQRSRSGGKGGLKLRGLKANIQSMPKIGGFKSLRPKLQVVNLKDLESNFKNGDIVSAKELVGKKLIKTKKIGVKVLGMGKMSKKITLRINKISATALEAIEKAGGQVVLFKKKQVNTKKDKLSKEEVKEPVTAKVEAKTSKVQIKKTTSKDKVKKAKA